MTRRAYYLRLAKYHFLGREFDKTEYKRNVPELALFYPDAECSADVELEKEYRELNRPDQKAWLMTANLFAAALCKDSDFQFELAIGYKQEGAQV